MPTLKVEPASSPPVAPASTLVTLTRPKIGIVGLVTVRVVLDPAAMIAKIAGDQLGGPQAWAASSRSTAGGTSDTAQVTPAGSPFLVADPPSATVRLPVMPAPQLYFTVKFGSAPPR